MVFEAGLKVPVGFLISSCGLLAQKSRRQGGFGEPSPRLFKFGKKKNGKRGPAACTWQWGLVFGRETVLFPYSSCDIAANSNMTKLVFAFSDILKRNRDRFVGGVVSGSYHIMVV